MTALWAQAGTTSVLLWVVGGIVALIAVLAMFVIGQYNGLVALRNRFKNAYAQIDVQLKRRYGPDPEPGRGRQGLHEPREGDFGGGDRGPQLGVLPPARPPPTAPGDPSAMQKLGQAEGQLNGALGRLFALSEAYPDLKANTNMMALQEELTSTENKVSFARQAYNDLRDAVQHPSRDLPHDRRRQLPELRARQAVRGGHREGEAGPEGVVLVILRSRWQIPDGRFPMADSKWQINKCHRESGICHRESGICHRESGICHRESGICHRESGICHRESPSPHPRPPAPGFTRMATDFFDRQDHARRQTGWLVFYFVVAVALIILTVYAAFTAIVVGGQSAERGAPKVEVYDPVRLAGVAVVTGTVILLGSVFKTLALREGGAAVARSLGGRLVDGETKDPAERRLLNIVEEMALASGMPVPPVYLMDEETSINAFAAGHTPGDAVIGVTRGSLQHLNRDQLQGVIAHEFSHILNGDMRLDLKLVGILHGILLLALIGQILMRMTQYSGSNRGRSDDKKDNSALAFFLMGVALFAIGYIGVFFGRLIKSAVSRQREFLADASAVQFTRNPEGLAGALKKIGGLAQGALIRSPEAEETSHMFFGSAVGAVSSLLSTHPPLEERIKFLDPQFDGQFPVVAEDEQVDASEPRPKSVEARDPSGIGGLGKILPGIKIPGNLGGAVLLPSAGAVSSVGEPSPQHLEFASGFLGDLPDEILSAAREPFGAAALVYALLLDPGPEIRSSQFAGLSQHAARGIAEEAMRLAPLVASLGAEARVPAGRHGLARSQAIVRRAICPVPGQYRPLDPRRRACEPLRIRVAAHAASPPRSPVPEDARAPGPLRVDRTSDHAGRGGALGPGLDRPAGAFGDPERLRRRGVDPRRGRPGVDASRGRVALGGGRGARRAGPGLAPGQEARPGSLRRDDLLRWAGHDRGGRTPPGDRRLAGLPDAPSAGSDIDRLEDQARDRFRRTTTRIGSTAGLARRTENDAPRDDRPAIADRPPVALR